MNRRVRVGAVVLTYNSAEDLPACLDGLLSQVGVDLRVIVVDNASSDQSRALMQASLRERVPDAPVLPVAAATAERVGDARAVFVVNDRNAGYSAGNNIGARLAVAGGCEAVLIVNPDVRIEDAGYVAALAERMTADPTCAVASSRILGLSGRDENPLREPGFWEELLWPRQFAPKAFRPKPIVVPPVGPGPVIAEKVHGCCMLLRATFLEDIGYLDENVFLYCEEPILAAQARRRGGRLIVVPGVTALHAHVASRKGNSSRRMLQFIRSRLYYINAYSTHNRVRRVTLRGSYALLYAFHRLKAGMQGT